MRVTLSDLESESESDVSSDVESEESDDPDYNPKTEVSNDETLKDPADQLHVPGGFSRDKGDKSDTSKISRATPITSLTQTVKIHRETSGQPFEDPLLATSRGKQAISSAGVTRE